MILEQPDKRSAADSFYNPIGVAVDGAGNIFVADNNNTIRKITPAGAVTTLAGRAGSFGSVDGTGAAASFYYPTAVAVDGAGNAFVADRDNHTIRKITPAGDVTTLAGVPGLSGSWDSGSGWVPRFHCPEGVAVDRAGNVFVADTDNNTYSLPWCVSGANLALGEPGQATHRSTLPETAAATASSGRSFSWPSGCPPGPHQS